MKTLLLRPFTDSTTGNSPPLSLMYLSSYLKSKGQSVQLWDKCVDKKVSENPASYERYLADLFREIEAYGPALVGMTLFSKELREIADLCRRIKAHFPSVLILLGGAHPTAMPEETLEQVPACDIVVRGEGEIVLHDLVKTLEGGGDLREVRGISFRDRDGKVVSGTDAEAPADLDLLPFPDRESLIDNYRNGSYSSFVYGSPSDLIMTSRGCPYQCSFCFKVCGRYRSRSPQNVLEEVDWIAAHVKPKCLQIMDDSFTIQKQRSLEILDGLIERNYPFTLKVRSRVDAVDEELLARMKQAGVSTVVYGLESGSQKMLDAFHKKTTVEQNVAACRMTRRAGLTCLGDMILFYPGETRETLKETERFIRKARPTAVNFLVLSPLPRTQAYEDAKKNGTLVGDWRIGGEMPWVRIDGFEGPKQMQNIAKRMFVKALLNPRRIAWLLQAYGKFFLQKPAFTLRMVFYNVIRKDKNY